MKNILSWDGSNLISKISFIKEHFMKELEHNFVECLYLLIFTFTITSGWEIFIIKNWKNPHHPYLQLLKHMSIEKSHLELKSN